MTLYPLFFSTTAKQIFRYLELNWSFLQSKMSSSKRFNCKGTLRQVFFRVYRLEVRTVCQFGIFDPALWICCPFNLLSGSTLPPSPLPCVKKYTVYTTVCKRDGVGYGVLGFRQINICRKVPLQFNFLDGDILYCLLWVLSFYDAAYKEKTILLFVLLIYFLWRNRKTEKNIKRMWLSSTSQKMVGSM